MIVVEKASLALIVDLGRRGHMRDGVPWSGPLVPELMARANRSAGNEPGAAAMELHGAIRVRARAPVTLCTERCEVHILAPGDALSVDRDPRSRVRYLAVSGGFEVPVALGSRTTLLTAKLGGLGGVPIPSGATLTVGASRGTHEPLPPWDPASDRPFEVIGGPDFESFDPSAMVTLTSHTYQISAASDRAGTRLTGEALRRRGPDTLPSAPMIAGAIQVAADGAPIVLGPDHPTTGGYPVVAVVAWHDLGRFGSHPIGAFVRFREV